MHVKFEEKNSKIVDMIQSVDLAEIFSIIKWGAKDKAIQDRIDVAITMLNQYASNYHNHEGNFLPAAKPVMLSQEEKKVIGKRSKKSFHGA